MGFVSSRCFRAPPCQLRSSVFERGTAGGQVLSCACFLFAKSAYNEMTARNIQPLRLSEGFLRYERRWLLCTHNILEYTKCAQNTVDSH